MFVDIVACSPPPVCVISSLKPHSSLFCRHIMSSHFTIDKKPFKTDFEDWNLWNSFRVKSQIPSAAAAADCDIMTRTLVDCTNMNHIRNYFWNCCAPPACTESRSKRCREQQSKEGMKTTTSERASWNYQRNRISWKRARDDIKGPNECEKMTRSRRAHKKNCLCLCIFHEMM